MCQWGDASPHGQIPWIRHCASPSSATVALIIVVGRLIMVVCQQGGKMRTGSASLVRSLPLHRSAGPQVRILPPTVIIGLCGVCHVGCARLVARLVNGV